MSTETEKTFAHDQKLDEKIQCLMRAIQKHTSGKSHLLQTKDGYEVTLTIKRVESNISATKHEILCYLKGITFALGIEVPEYMDLCKII